MTTVTNEVQWRQVVARTQIQFYPKRHQTKAWDSKQEHRHSILAKHSAYMRA